MPLVAYELFGDWSDTETHVPAAHTYSPMPVDNPDAGRNSFVSKIDRALIQKPETRVRIEKYLSRLDVNFYILFLNSPAGLRMASQHLDLGQVDIGEFADYLADEPTLVARVAAIRAEDPEACIVVLTHNEGGRVRHPLTPWMIFHRIGHSLGGLNLLFWHPDVLRPICRAYKFTPMMIGIVPYLATMRSVREGVILTNFAAAEIRCEMFAQYVICGRITLRMPEELNVSKLPHHDGRYVLTSDVELLSEARAALVKLERAINAEAGERIAALRSGSIRVC